LTSFRTCPLDGDEPVSEFEDRKAFLDYHFARWLLVEFAKDETTGKAKLHVLKAQDVCVEWQGHYYAGIRFRMPEWLDGDFKWFSVFERKKEHEGRCFVYKWNLHKPPNTQI
jgi:hypothetical protein